MSGDWFGSRSLSSGWSVAMEQLVVILLVASVASQVYFFSQLLARLISPQQICQLGIVTDLSTTSI